MEQAMMRPSDVVFSWVDSHGYGVQPVGPLKYPRYKVCVW